MTASRADPGWLLLLALSTAATGLVSGTLAGLLGVGGGIVIVPVLSYVLPLLGIDGGTLGVPGPAMFGMPIRRAVGTASAFGIISMPATLMTIALGWRAPGNPPWSLGYVSLIGVALIAPTSILATPWGVTLAHSIPPLLLKRAFAVFLALTSARMVWSVRG